MKITDRVQISKTRQNRIQYAFALFILAIILFFGITSHFQSQNKLDARVSVQDSLRLALWEKDSLARELQCLKEDTACRGQFVRNSILSGKIAQAKLRKFSRQVLNDRKKILAVLDEAKEAKKQALLENQAVQEQDSFFFYQRKVIAAARNLLKTDQALFTKYAVARFMNETVFDISYDCDAINLELNAKPISSFYAVESAVNTAVDSVYQRSARFYDQQFARIDSEYQAKQKALDKKCAIRIAKKAKALGLSK